MVSKHGCIDICINRFPATRRISHDERSFNSGDSIVGRYPWLFRRNSEFDPPARESMTVRENGGVHFIEIAVSGRAAFESLLSPNPNACLDRSVPVVFEKISPVQIPTKRKPCTQS
jgi:hypothetical protein